MRPNQAYRRRSSTGFWFGLLLILMMATGGVVGLLLLLGVNLNPFAKTVEDPFMVRIPINSQPIPAYQRVDRSHLLNPASGGIFYQRVPPAATVGMSITGVSVDGSHVESRVESIRNSENRVVFVVTDGREVPQDQTIALGGAMMNVNAIIGRVVKKDKRAGMGFREETFFPQGTPEGIAGATPPGMRAITLDATKLTGVHALNAGDRIDLMASVPMSDLGSFQSHHSGRLPGGAMIVSASEKSAEATEPILLAQQAVVLKPVYVRNEAMTSSSLTQGKRVQNVPKYEVAIAVAPDDIIPLQSALNKSLPITCVAHSMQSSVADAHVAGDGHAHKDQALVPVTVRAILAYDVVTRDAFVSSATRRVRMEPVNQQEIDRLGIITSVDVALGAVARHDIPAGRYLRKSDLLSGSLLPALDRGARTTQDSSAHRDAAGHSRGVFQLASRPGQPMSIQHTHDDMHGQTHSTAPSAVGDRPAVTSFVPPGHTAFALPWNRLYGAEHLQIGDEIDLLASYSLQSDTEEEETETRPDGTKIVRKRTDTSARNTLRSWDETFGLRGEPWFIATNALVIGPVGFPPPAAAQRALGTSLSRPAAGESVGSFSGPPLIVAVDDRDVDAVVAVLATQEALFTPAFHPSGANESVPQGMKRIVISAQDIQAYEQLTETVWNGNRRRPLSRLVSSDDTRFATALTEREIQEFEFRVLGREKRRGDFFTAGDFLPDGVAPGVAAAASLGSTVFAVADREIEGLDAFQADDYVAILERAVLKAPSGVIAHGIDLERPVSNIVVPKVRIVRASRSGQTILEVANEDLTRLQAAWAASVSEENGSADKGQRSHLMAVALPRTDSGNLADPVASRGAAGAGTQFASLEPLATNTQQPIPDFNPVRGMKLLEARVGSRSEMHAFPAGRSIGDNSSTSNNLGRAK